MDKPNNNALRPYKFREIIRQLFQIYWQNFVPFVVLAAIIQIPLTLAGVLVQRNLQQPMQNLLGKFNNFQQSNPAAVSPEATAQILSPLLEIVLVMLGVYLVSSFIQAVLISGPVAYITSENRLGRMATLGQAIRVLSQRAGTLVGQMSLYYTLIILLGVLLSLILFACGLGFGLLVYVIVTVGAFLVPVAVLERTGVLDGLRRAWTLCKARIWPVLGLAVLLMLFNFAIESLLDVLPGMLSADGSLPAARLILGTVLTVLLSPILPIGLTLFYYDARIRLEALDVALQRAKLLNPVITPSEIVPPAPGPLFKNEDFLNLAIITMGTFVLLLLYMGAIFLIGGGSSLSAMPIGR